MIVVTGATGLLGSHLLCELTQRHKKVVAGYQTYSKITSVYQVFKYYLGHEADTYFNTITWRKMDILDLQELDDAIHENDEVYHCAALVSFHRADFAALMKINREGTANVVNTCLDKKAAKLCYVSSTAAIGGGQEGMLSETDKWKKSKNTSAYSISKFSAEKEVWRGIAEGLNAVMVNPCVILGAGKWEGGSMEIFNHLKNGANFYPPGANATVDARDVAFCMAELMEKNIFNDRFLLIGSNQSFKELFYTITKSLGVNMPKSVISARFLRFLGFVGSAFTYLTSIKLPISNDTVRSAIGTTEYSAKKIKNTLNFKFQSFDETVQNAINGRIK